MMNAPGSSPPPQADARKAQPLSQPSSQHALPQPLPRKRRMLRLSMVPTMITLGNTVSGVLAISYLIDAAAIFGAAGTDAVARAAGSGKIAMAGWMILLGMVFDGLDGRVARLTRSTSNFGGQLDSLADVVSFGVAPALLAKTIAEQVLHWGDSRAPFVAAIFYALCATLRLARYNAEHEEPDAAVRHFSGLPTPGAAGAVAGVAICHVRVLEWLGLDADGAILAARILCFVGLIGLGMLMVSRVPYAHFANRFLSGRRPVGRVALIVLVIALCVATNAPEVVVATGFVLYALGAPLLVIPRLIMRRREAVPELLDA